MSAFDRRLFLKTSSAMAVGTMTVGTMALETLTAPVLQAAETASAAEGLTLSTFRFDVTPPLGHSMCGGWITPAAVVDDPLEAIGFILQGAGKPIVICSVDWTGLLNEAHVAWREAIAEAAGTTADRVAVHCVHQHNAPFACLEAERIVAAQGDLPHIVDVAFFNRCLEAARVAVTEALKTSQPVTHIAEGEAPVSQVASNRSLIGLDGFVVSQRGSSSKNPVHHRYPEGLIDPMLKTVAFYHGEKKIAACHYYACHPMSYYGDGRVSADFCGLARRKRQAEEPECLHLYFNGCGGNIGAGKYNDGSRELRPVLMQRIYEGIVNSEAALQPQPIQEIRWSTTDILPAPQEKYRAEDIQRQIENKSLSVVNRNRPAYTWGWLQRYQKQIPITLSALHINKVSLLHLPAESFVEYQLRAQAAAPDRFVACAAYGDGGPWYIPVRDAYPRRGYEASVAWCSPEIDDMLCGGMKTLLTEAKSR